jgi:hypothetical protein
MSATSEVVLPEIPSEINESFFEITPSVIRNRDAALDNLTAVNGIRKADIEFYEILLSLAVIYVVSTTEPVKIPYSIVQQQLEAKNKPSTRQTILRRSKAFVDEGIFSKSQFERESGGGRPHNRYSTEPIHLSEFAERHKKRATEAVQGRKVTRGRTGHTNASKLIKQLEQSNAQYLKAVTNSHPLTDSWWSGVLDRSMRFDSWEEIEGNVITNSIRIGKARLTVQATTQTGKSSEIAILSDQRIIRAIVTEIVRIIEEKIEKHLEEKLADSQDDLFTNDVWDNDQGGFVSAPAENDENPETDQLDLPHIENSFFIDVVRIARKSLGYSSPSSGTIRLQINAAIRRLYETNFRVLLTAENPEAAAAMRKKYGLDDDTMDFRFITDLKSQFQEGFAPEGVDAQVEDLPSRAQYQLSNYEDLSDEELEKFIDPFHEAELKRVRLWKISIDSHLFNRLKDKEARSIFIAHEEILRERSGLAQTLYNLLSHKIGRTNQQLTGGQEQKISTSFERLHNLLWPGRRFARFEEHFFALLRRHSKSPQALAKAITEANVAKRKKPFSPQKIAMFGFIFLLSIHKGDWYITIYRDRDDDINGDNSYHNRMLAKSRK